MEKLAISVKTIRTFPVYALYMSLVNAIDSGYVNYWFEVTTNSGYGPARKSCMIVEEGEGGCRRQYGDCPEAWSEYLARQVFFEGGFVEAIDAEDPDTRFPLLTMESYQHGLQIMADETTGRCPIILDRLAACDTDAEDDDIILQYALFGKQVYG